MNACTRTQTHASTHASTHTHTHTHTHTDTYAITCKDLGCREPGLGFRHTYIPGTHRHAYMQVVMEQRMEMQRVKSGESPLTFECRGWDGTTQPGKQPVCAGAGPQLALTWY